jgi:hypothetical protein
MSLISPKLSQAKAGCRDTTVGSSRQAPDWQPRRNRHAEILSPVGPERPCPDPRNPAASSRGHCADNHRPLRTHPTVGESISHSRRKSTRILRRPRDCGAFSQAIANRVDPKTEARGRGASGAIRSSFWQASAPSTPGELIENEREAIR